MGAKTGIAWTRSSFNPWIGCTKVSPGCNHCYAEVSRPVQAMGIQWGTGQPRRRTTSTWGDPPKWDRIAAMERETGKVVAQDVDRWTKPGFYPVFPSLCDPFDNEVPEAWREDFWKLIEHTPHLTWLLLTKRIGNAEKMLRGWSWPNVWLGASIVTQEEADRDIPKLLAVPAAKRFVSYEPALGPVDFEPFISMDQKHVIARRRAGGSYQPSRIDQIIVGGESNQGAHKARPFNIEWARSTVNQCKAAGVSVFVKQLGSAPYYVRLPNGYEAQDQVFHEPFPIKDRAGADPAEWPSHLRVQEFPA
jgi:protein gp37